jgi:hypothetical protein
MHFDCDSHFASLVTRSRVEMSFAFGAGIFLHPDFGVDKTNQLIRKAHKIASRLVLAIGWVTAIGGLLQLTNDVKVLALYSVPLLALIPFTLV